VPGEPNRLASRNTYPGNLLRLCALTMPVALDRAGMPIWDVGDRALYRAAQALEIRLGGKWRARKDDRWMLAFYDHAYKTNWSRGQDVWGAGKNAGWGYVLVPREANRPAP